MAVAVPVAQTMVVAVCGRGCVPMVVAVAAAMVMSVTVARCAAFLISAVL